MMNFPHVWDLLLLWWKRIRPKRIVKTVTLAKVLVNIPIWRSFKSMMNESETHGWRCTLANIHQGPKQSSTGVKQRTPKQLNTHFDLKHIETYSELSEAAFTLGIFIYRKRAGKRSLCTDIKGKQNKTAHTYRVPVLFLSNKMPIM